MSLPPFFAALGSDHFLTPDEAAAHSAPHAELDTAWRFYANLFGGFCGSRIDPQFWRHVNPARSLGTLAVDADTTVIVVGTGPSLTRRLPALKLLRSRVLLFTSPHGADVLAGHGIQPDLVVVDPHTSVDDKPAPIAGRTLTPAGGPLVAVSPRAPMDFTAGIPVDRLFVPDPLPTWGLWPATAVALAASAGARRIGLLGVDLDDTDGSADWPLGGVLSLLAWIADVPCLDCGQEGAVKAGWPVATLEEAAGDSRALPPEVTRTPWLSMPERFDLDRARLEAIDPIVRRARTLLSLGLRAQAGARWPGDARAMEQAAIELCSWRDDAAVRVTLQDTLGLSFLPRLWRCGVELQLGFRLWRPIVLAAHELVHQADKLESRLALRMCA
jgi:hypothetical protein